MPKSDARQQSLIGLKLPCRCMSHFPCSSTGLMMAACSMASNFTFDKLVQSSCLLEGLNSGQPTCL